MERKLVTILVADYVGSTPDMVADEESAIKRIGLALDLASGFVTKNQGRVFNTAGDGMLAEFSSPVNALHAAIEARASLASAPGLSPSSMRFGLHVADVVTLGEDLRGNGVNIAARLQDTADPGEIDVSKVLYDHVRHVSPCRFKEMGPRQLKGLPEPIDVMRVRSSVDRHLFQAAPTIVNPTSDMQPNSVVVRPFLASGPADDEQQYLVDGLTEDIIHDLSRLKSLFVSSRSASRSLDIDDPVKIGKALGVRYVLSGSVRKLGTRVNLNITLSGTHDGDVVWSERYKRPFEELLDMMDEITARVASTVSGRIDHAEIAAARQKRPENMTAYDHYLQGLEHHRLSGVDQKHAIEARNCFERAEEADPQFARAIAMQICAWSYLPDFDVSASNLMISRALELDPTDPEVRRIFGIVSIKENNDFQSSRLHHEMAIKLAPNDAYIIGRCAAFYIFVGTPEKALSLLDRAEQLDPFLPVWIVEERVAALYAMDRFEDLAALARTLAFQTHRTRLYRAAARVARGEMDRASALIAEALADDPDLSCDYVLSQELYKDQKVLNTLLDRLQAAGLPPADADTSLAIAATDIPSKAIIH